MKPMLVMTRVITMVQDVFPEEVEIVGVHFPTRGTESEHCW